MIIFFDDYEIKIKDEEKTKKIICSTQNEEAPYDNLSTYQFISFMYILSRGFCYAFTVAKSYRVLVGF
jgi:hypothetical protein